MLEVTLVPILQDNYAYILQSGNDVAVLDPGDAAPVIDKLNELNLTPTTIFITHHHWDHVDGIRNIKEKYNCTVIAPETDKDRIPLMDKGINEESNLSFGGENIEIIETPGHTKNHICLHFPKSHILFSGDTLFAMGCGRLFEGSAEDMFKAFEKLKKLPDSTQIYCGHEYTQSNGEFCLTIEPTNPDLVDRMQDVASLRAQNKPTIPTTLGLEKKTNIFMRAKDANEFKKFRDLKDKA